MLDGHTEGDADFRGRGGTALDIRQCECEACPRIYVLDLKFILHAGGYVTQEIAGKPKLVGPEVVMAHRLLKNNAAKLVGHSAYALVTTAAAAQLDIPTEDAVPIAEVTRGRTTVGRGSGRCPAAARATTTDRGTAALAGKRAGRRSCPAPVRGAGTPLPVSALCSVEGPV